MCLDGMVYLVINTHCNQNRHNCNYDSKQANVGMMVSDCYSPFLQLQAPN